jgi:hypothetical protein
MRHAWADVLFHLGVAVMRVIERSGLFDVTKNRSSSSHLQSVLFDGMSVLLGLGLVLVLASLGVGTLSMLLNGRSPI